MIQLFSIFKLTVEKSGFICKIKDPPSSRKHVIPCAHETVSGYGITSFFPTDRAIAYREDECLLIMDEKMPHLRAKFGRIASKALANFKISSEAYMAQFELELLAAKAKEEYVFAPLELS